MNDGGPPLPILLILLWWMLNLNAVAALAALPADRQYARDPLRRLEGKLWDELCRAGPSRSVKWKQFLGVEYDTFWFIVELVRDDLDYDHNYNNPWHGCLEERVAVSLYYLHTGIPYRQMELSTGRAPNTIGKWVKAFVNAICKTRADTTSHFTDWVYTPSDAELADICEGYERMRGSRLPGCVGAIDGTHIPFSTSDPAFENYKGYHSIVAQAIVDHKLRIRSWSAGHAGSNSDLNVLAASKVRTWIDDLATKGVRDIGGVDVSYYLVGDGMYTHRSCLQIPFDGEHGRSSKEYFWNKKQSSARQTVERAFGVLKGRWAVLAGGAHGQMHHKDHQYVARISATCAVLHNICITRGDTIPKEDEVPHGWGCLWENTNAAGPLVFGSSEEDRKHAESARLKIIRRLRQDHRS